MVLLRRKTSGVHTANQPGSGSKRVTMPPHFCKASHLKFPWSTLLALLFAHLFYNTSQTPTKTSTSLNATETHRPGWIYKPNTQSYDYPTSKTPPQSILHQKSPSYQIESRFDFQSINLALNQEWIELDLLRYGLNTFSKEQFQEAGLNSSEMTLISFMADQEVSHATVLSNMLGPRSARPCHYQYPFTTVRGFIDFAQKLTRWGESGVYGFLSFLENPNSAQILLQSIATEARQQMIFRQFEGLFPVTIYHVPAIPQSWAWTLLHPYLKSCPKSNPFVEFDIYPALHVLNNPVPFSIDPNARPGVATVRESLSQPGRQVFFKFDQPGRSANPDGAYKTISHAKSLTPKFAAWASQYNVTYSELKIINSTSAWTIQPFATLIPNQIAYPAINGTIFVVLTDTKLFVTPSNITSLNEHIVAGPAVYQVD